jgi:transposase
MHHKNALAHMSLLTRSHPAKRQISVVPQPPYSPDFYLFPKLKTRLKRCCFQTIQEIQENAIRELHAITERAFQEAFQQ